MRLSLVIIALSMQISSYKKTTSLQTPHHKHISSFLQPRHNRDWINVNTNVRLLHKKKIKKNNEEEEEKYIQESTERANVWIEFIL